MADKRKRTSDGSAKSGGGVISSVVEQTTRIAGEVLGSASDMTNMARETGADWVKGVSPTAAEVIRPGKRQKSQAKRSTGKTKTGKAAVGEARAARKAAASAGRATASAAKSASKTASRAASSVSKGGRSKSSKKR